MFLPLFLAMSISANASAPDPSRSGDHVLWFSQPAPDWNSALPIGNGRLGAMVFGGTERELFQLNDDTFWAGHPHDYSDPQAHAVLPEIRRLLFEGKDGEATRLADQKFMGSPKFQAAYQPLGDLILEGFSEGKVDGYLGQLDLLTGLCTTEYEAGGVGYRREAFVSHPHRVLAVRLEATGPQGLEFSASLTSPYREGVRLDEKGALVLTGQWKDDGRRRDWTASWTKPGIRYAIGIRLHAEGGRVVAEGDRLRVEGARRATLFLTSGTSFVDYRDISGDPETDLIPTLDRASRLGYERVRAAHLKDFRERMDRSYLDLPETESSRQATDKRIEAVRGGASDPALASLYYQFGRYLLVSSSRPGTQPANLQGIWNKDVGPAWGSKYTTNINLQMNYWPAEVANLSECTAPLFALMRDLSVTGGKTAWDYYRARGWVLHHNTDLWRGAAPVDGVWGVWPMGSAWLARHAWEHYDFGRDRRFLRQEGWPLMRGAARFALDFLMEAPASSKVAGKLVTNPSHSPENAFRRPDGRTSQFTYGATMDLQIVEDLFRNSLKALSALGKLSAEDSALKGEIEAALGRLAPLQISPKTGRLQEWIEDFEEVEPGHRHMSHLYALYPGDGISLGKTPELARAARKSLEARLANGGGGTGWSRAWLVSLFARLADGDEAWKHFSLLIGRSTQPNLLDSHPPFQIDGNFAGCAGLAEMLLQSHEQAADGRPILHLLPALPRDWAKAGHAKGLRARGGFEVDLTWEDGRTTSCRVRSLAGAPAVLRANGKDEAIDLGRGQERTFRFE